MHGHRVDLIFWLLTAHWTLRGQFWWCPWAEDLSKHLGGELIAIVPSNEQVHQKTRCETFA
jgi:hypothetical protein